jgi:hypothetical protein
MNSRDVREVESHKERQSQQESHGFTEEATQQDIEKGILTLPWKLDVQVSLSKSLTNDLM